MLALHDFQTGSLELRKFIESSHSYGFKDFKIFLKVLECFGTGYVDDVDRSNYNQRQKITHEQQAIDEIRGIIGFIKHIKKSMDGIFEPDQERLMNDYMLMLDLIVEGFRNCIVILEKAKATNDFDTI